VQFELSGLAVARVSENDIQLDATPEGVAVELAPHQSRQLVFTS
jgi:hypothetical protein